MILLGPLLLVFSALWSCASKAAALIEAESCPSQLETNIPCYPVNGSCYCFSFRTASWNEANTICRSNSQFHGRLLSIETEEEQIWLEEEIQFLPGINLLSSFWTSGSDSQVDGFWFWTATGAFLSYENWPDNFTDAEDEDCLVLDRDSHYLWDDQDCQSSTHFICEQLP